MLKKLLKPLYIVIGCLSFVAGCVGIVLPVLPTVPFFLLTSFCFARGSERFSNWFLATKVYKKYVSGFAELRAMSFGGELGLLLFVSVMLISACIITNSKAMMIVMPILELVKYSYFIFRIKTVSSAELKSLKAKREAVKLQQLQEKENKSCCF